MIESNSAQLDTFDRLAMVVHALTSDVGADEILEIVIRQGMAGSNASGAAIAFRHGDALAVVAAAGTTAASLKRLGPVTITHRNPGSQAVATGEPVWLPDRAEAIARFPDLRFASAASQGWAALPLMAGGTPFGSLSLSFGTPPVFDPVERRYLEALADVTALALSRQFVTDAETTVASITVIDELVLDPDDAVVVANESGEIVAVNDQLLDLLGYEHERLVGHSVDMLLPPSARHDHALHRRQYANDPTPRPFASGLDTVAQRADGSELAVHISLSPFTTRRDGVCVAAVLRPRHP